MVELAPVQGGQFAKGFAGDTFNTAWYLRRVLPGDSEVAFLSAVGTDSISQEMLGFMADEGIDTSHVQRLRDRSVGLYMIHLNGAERSFSYWRSVSAARSLADDGAWIDAALADVDLVYLSGITLAILAPKARARLRGALGRARAAGTQVAFDPNIRPALWDDRTTMRRNISEMAAQADIVLPSFDDEASHFGDADPFATALRYGAGGAGLVVVKDGPRPVVTRSGAVTALHRVPAAAGSVVDTTAAGDSFNAGFLANLLAGASLETAVGAGAALAGRVIAGPGALVRSAIAPLAPPQPG